MPEKTIRPMRIAALAIVLMSLLFQSVFSFQQASVLTKDEVYFSLARRINEQSESPVSAIVGALGEVIEVGQITVGADGKTTVIVKELAPSTPRVTNRSIRLIFVPSGEKDKWKWESFEDNRKLYPVERLFPYTKDRLGVAKANAERVWANLLEIMTREGETAMRVLETARAITKSDPAPLLAMTKARGAFLEAVKSKETTTESLLSSHRELQMAIEPVMGLADTYPDLRANDAYLRLFDELKILQNVLRATRKAYTDAVDVYNDDILRLPFALVAYGMEFTRMEAKIQAE